MATATTASIPMTPPLCKHWARSKTCLYHSNGGKCKFDHPVEYELPTDHSKQQQLRHRSAGGRLQTRNDTRVAKFRSFIASHISLQDCHALDVAGGKGELAFQLLNLSNAASCHVVDPRRLCLNRFQKRRQRGFYHRSAAFVHQDIVTSPDDPERPVQHLQCMFATELWANASENDNNVAGNKNNNNEVAFETNCQNTQAWTWPPQNNHEHASCCKHDDRDDDPTPNHQRKQTPTFQHARSIVQQATLIVGMHPDQAVDAIVDAALALNISFFVVPCCTYSAEFPHRRTADDKNKRVTTYEELLDYLQNKSPDIQRALLPFEGKNVCLYRVV
mmetsp:Transcript_4770/g.11311  ORF Transcript_4770/g.11311 Transcript_4770/m.11311 type:complete len:332 (+) Transcript_4770:99-1094(+)